MHMTCECGSVYDVGRLGEGMYRVDGKLKGYCAIERKVVDQRPATIRELALTVADNVVSHYKRGT
jgi:hypothetical protein